MSASYDRGYKPPEGGYGWVVLISAVVVNSCIMPLTQWFGILYNKKVNDMEFSAADISFLLHLNNAIMCGVGIFSGPLLKRYNFRQVAFIGCTLACSGIFLTAFLEKYAGLIFSIGILLGMGQGILLPATYIAVNTYFKEKLTLAVTLQVTGVGLVPIVMPQICIYLLEQFGLRSTILIFGALSLHSIPAAILMRPIKVKKRDFKSSPTPDDDFEEMKRFLPEKSSENVYQETTTPKPKKQDSVVKEILKSFNFSLLLDKTYVVILLGMSISFASELNIVLMISFILKELGLNLKEIGHASSVQSAADIFGRLVIPLVMQRMKVSPKIGYCVALICASLGRTTLALFHFKDSTFSVYPSMIIIGLSKGIKAVYQSLVIPKYVEFSKLPAATGLNMVFNGAFSLIIGPIIGLAHDITGTYISTLYTATSLSLFCVCLWLFEYSISLITNKKTDLMTNNKV